MQNKKIEKKISFINIIAAFTVTLALVIGGSLLKAVVPSETHGVFGILGIVSVVLLTVLFIFNKTALKIYLSKQKNHSVAEWQEYILSLQSGVKDDLDTFIRRIRRFGRFFIIYTALTIIIMLVPAFTSAFVRLNITFALLTYFCLRGFFDFLPKTSAKKAFKDYTNPDDYPKIHSLARKAADTLGIHGEIRICLESSYDAAIAKIGKTYSILLGVRLLDILSEDEMYNIFLHEFGHMTEKANKTPFEGRLYTLLNSSEQEGSFSTFFSQFTAFPGCIFSIKYTIFSMVTSIYIEKEADNAVVEKGNASDAAHALIKIHLTERFDDELAEFNIFESEEPRTDLIRTYAEMYKQALRDRGDFWITLAKKEIEPRGASHPILRNRLAPLGVTEMEIVFPDDTGSDYRKEADKAFAFIEKQVTEYTAEDYEQKRKRNYLEPMKVVEKWEACGCSIAPEQSREVIDALCDMNRYEKAENLCDKVIAESENVFATPYAHYMKGFFLARRYDRDCLDHFYKAMELNNNYIETGLEEIGKFCCIMGLNDELEEYRKRATEFAQKSVDEESTGFKDGKLLTHSLSDEKLNAIIDFIKSVDADKNVSEVFCVDHITSKNYRETSFVLKFNNYDSDLVHDVYNKVFNLLDTDPDGTDYSLAVCDDDTEKAVKAVNGSSVFKR